MKNLSLFICLFTLSFTLSAQNQSIDVLKGKLKTLPQDSTYVNVLNDIATSFVQAEHFDSALRYIKPAVELTEKLPYLKGAVLAYYNLAQYNFHIKEYKPGKAFLMKSLNAALQVHDKRHAANNYKALANLYHLQGNFKFEADSKNKFTLYNDSATNEENAKQLAATATANELKEKEKTELAANELKAVAENEVQKQRIFYISLVVLIVLSILIIWLLVSRSKKAKKQTALVVEQVEKETVSSIDAPIGQKNKEKDTPAFLQKIIAKEALLANSTIEKKPSIIAAAPTEIITQVVIDENIEPKKAHLEEKIFNKAIQPEQLATKPMENEEAIEKIAVLDDEIPTAIGGNYSVVLSLGQLLNFTAKLIIDKVKLVWKTSVDQNIMRFELEKSVDMVQFVAIESVATNSGFAYETFDFKPLPGKNYYRLKIYDNENNFIDGPVVQVTVLPATTLTLVCYPTHAKNVIMVTAAGGKLPVMVNIYDTAGKKQFFIEVPPTTTPIYISNLADGSYSLQMKCQGKTMLQQLIKKS